MDGEAAAKREGQANTHYYANGSLFLTKSPRKQTDISNPPSWLCDYFPLLSYSRCKRQESPPKNSFLGTVSLNFQPKESISDRKDGMHLKIERAPTLWPRIDVPGMNVFSVTSAQKNHYMSFHSWRTFSAVRQSPCHYAFFFLLSLSWSREEI